MIAQGCPQLTDVTLSGCKKISDTGLRALAVNLPRMTSIDLCLTYNMTNVGITAIAERCPALVKISILAGCQSAYGSVVLNESIWAIARGCPKLRTISISCVDELSDGSVAFLAERCKELRSVYLRRCALVTDGAIIAIANSCPDIEKLDLGGRPMIDEYGTSFSGNITDESFIIVGRKCSKLVDISITHNIVTDIGIAALARGCPQLRSFSAHDCPSISTDGMMALSHGCKELRTMNLSDCERIIDDSFFRIAEGCPELSSFTLSSSEAVTNAGISCIARGCEKLLYITIIDCGQIDDTALITIGSSCPNLLGITVTARFDSPSPRFSDRGLTAIARGCPAMESISLSICPDMTDASVIIFAQKCFQLKSISLASSKITDASVIAFVTNSRKLQSVSFYFGDCITSTGLSIIAAECTQMQKICLFSCYEVGIENLLSLRRRYLLAKTSEHNRSTSLLSMLWHFISYK